MHEVWVLVSNKRRLFWVTPGPWVEDSRMEGHKKEVIFLVRDSGSSGAFCVWLEFFFVC